MTAFDVIVIGAGHAGSEAAFAAARLGCHVGLCTLSLDTVAHMPCNPAIGGTAKGHLVREIDAVGGLMGRAIDATGIQFKLLNRSRGPAVWSPRAQADKRRYAEWMRATLEATPGIEWVLGRAARLFTGAGRITGLELDDGRRYRCGALIVTAGTLSQRSGPRRTRAVGRGSGGRTRIARAGGIAEDARLHVGPAENRHAAPRAAPEHRFLPPVDRAWGCGAGPVLPT